MATQPVKAEAISTRAYAEHFGAVPDVRKLAGKALLLNASGKSQCVELVKQLAHAPSTQPENWKKGTALTPEYIPSLALGTPIATGWNAHNFYPNGATGQHAGLYAGTVTDKSGTIIGFDIIEQYVGAPSIILRTVYFDRKAHKKAEAYLNNGRDYATIQW